MKKLAILGLGHIGKYVFETLSNDSNFTVRGYDITTGHDLKDKDVVRSIVSSVDGVLASTPFYLNTEIATICNELGKDYFDLTESVDVTNTVKNFTNAKFVTQCGLAPGMVSILANNLAKDFLKIENIEIRVGALPQNANNHLGYLRTWNTEGLINEYIHPCPAIKNYKLVNLDPVSEFENVVLNGITLEAATTSGGLGSLAESYLNKAANVNYKTLRYPGHWNLIKFLKDDLGLKQNFNSYVKIFNNSIPQVDKDYVYILINVTGYIDNNYVVRQYSKVIDCDSNVTAIQKTTGSGVMSVLDVWNNGALDNLNGWIKQEQIDFDLIFNSKYSVCYH